MSIELKQAAEQALKELGEARKIIRASSSRQLAKDWDRRATDALANLRATIHQPVTGEPTPQDVIDAFEKARAGSDKPVGILRGVRAVMRMLPDLKPAPDPIAPATDEPVVDVRCEGCGYMTHHREHMGCVRAAKQHTHQAPSVPEGYALVPIEPTQAMLNVQTWDFNRFYSPREIWAAMLAAK